MQSPMQLMDPSPVRGYASACPVRSCTTNNSSYGMKPSRRGVSPKRSPTKDKQRYIINRNTFEVNSNNTTEETN
ncbi:hypothetical protein Tsubulata_011975 [Turnera subulata]|uniref:Uncharacterized protein n=1 Tax=Turnera subulata TaxID=218843 RepID=A0A9Q0J6G1_9ROSI|nr:hypothetical protein Tsubulata_011975 [Turnera subulata]